MSSTTATGESAAAAGEASASRPRQTAIARFIFGTPSESAGSLVAPAPEWFHGWIKNTWPVWPRNRPISPNGRRGQPDRHATRLPLASRDAVGIVISARFLPRCVAQPRLSQCRAQNPRALAGSRARDAGSKRHGFSFHGAALACVLPSRFWPCVAWPGRAPRTPAAPSPQQQPAATPSPSPSGQKGGAGRGNAAAHAACGRSSIACRRIPPPSRRWRCPGARSTSPPPRARSACSTTRASRRPISPIPPTSSTAPIAQPGR